jgi:hypothetical protein
MADKIAIRCAGDRLSVLFARRGRYRLRRRMVIKPSGGIRRRLGVWYVQRITRPCPNCHIDDTSQKEKGHQGRKEGAPQRRPERVFLHTPGRHEIVEGGHFRCGLASSVGLVRDSLPFTRVCKSFSGRHGFHVPPSGRFAPRIPIIEQRLPNSTPGV